MTPIGAPALRDGELLAWCEELVDAIFGEELAAAPAGQPGGGQPAGSHRSGDEPAGG